MGHMIVFRLLLVFLIGLIGCQKKPPCCQQVQEPDPLQYLRISFSSGIRSLNPGVGIDYPSAFVIKMLFEGLMHIGPNGEPQLAIAKSYEISEDHKTYIFHLRHSIWSNGDKLTAHDFAYAWKKIIDPHRGESLGVQNFYPIKNVKAIVKGEKSIDTAGIQVLNEKTLRVDLEHPTPYFLEVLATSSFLPIHSKIDESDPTWANQQGNAFVCNGPFSLEKHRLEDEIIVKKNPTYWDPSSVTMPGIKIAIIKNETTQLNLFEKNQLEWLGRPFSKMPLDAISYLKEHKKVEFIDTLGVYWYFLNVEAFPFDNKKMRQAFSYIVNRQLITDYILEENETPAMAVLPHSLATQEAPFFKDNNREKALELFNEALDEMGITKAELPEITVNYAASAPIHQRLAEALQVQWNQAFGLNIKLENQDWKVHYGKLQKGNFQIGGMAWQSWLRDPIYILQTFRDRSDGVNMSRWENAAYQTYLSQAEEEVDPARRRQLYNEAQSILMEEMPVIPIYFPTIAYSKSKKLKNVYISELFEADFRWAYFEE